MSTETISLFDLAIAIQKSPRHVLKVATQKLGIHVKRNTYSKPQAHAIVGYFAEHGRPTRYV